VRGKKARSREEKEGEDGERLLIKIHLCPGLLHCFLFI
jgi:hypothetical protein